MKIGDLVRPKSKVYSHHLGVVVKKNVLTIKVLLTNGRTVLYNRDVLEVINGRPESRKDKIRRKLYEHSISTWSTVLAKLVQAKNARNPRTQRIRPRAAR